MKQPSTFKRALRAAGALALVWILAGCANVAGPQPPGPPEPAAAPAIAQDKAAKAHESADGPPQPSRATGGLTSSRPGAALRAPVSPSAASAAFPSALPKGKADNDRMLAHFIDVGQGDAVLLEFSCGAVLIDTGGEITDEVLGRERLGEYLRGFFLRRPDLANTLKLVVLSHPHKDHTDGVSALLGAQPQITVENVLDNGASDKGSGITGQRALQRFVDESGAKYVGLTEADITSAAGVTSPVIDPIDCRSTGGVDPKITALWGRVDLDTAWANDANNDSVVLRVDFGKASFLFTGDLEQEGIEAMLTSYQVDKRVFDVDVLKVGHHGSHNATTPGLIAAVTPKIAVIQAGDSTLSRATFSAYSFGHPHKNTVQMLLDPQVGVTETRPAKQVPVGVRGRNPSTGAAPEFTSITLKRAIYANGWDGNIAVTAHKDGTLQVQTGY